MLIKWLWQFILHQRHGVEQNLLSQQVLTENYQLTVKRKLAGVDGLEPTISRGSKPVISALASIKIGWGSWT